MEGATGDSYILTVLTFLRELRGAKSGVPGDCRRVISEGLRAVLSEVWEVVEVGDVAGVCEVCVVCVVSGSFQAGLRRANPDGGWGS